MVAQNLRSRACRHAFHAFRAGPPPPAIRADAARIAGERLRSVRRWPHHRPLRATIRPLGELGRSSPDSANARGCEEAGERRPLRSEQRTA